MSVVINTNSAATIASANLSASNAMLKKSLARLSSGSKIVNASDDAGGVAVAARLSSAAKRTGAIQTNISNALSFLQHQDSNLKTIEKMLVRMSELVELHKDTTKSSADLDLYEDEFGALQLQVTAIQGLDWNDDVAVFADSMDVTVTEGGDTFAISDGTYEFDSGDIDDGVADDLTAIAAARSLNGAQQSTLGFYSELNAASKANFEAAVSAIVDVDVAEESTQLARWSTLVQAGTAMVAQANGSAVAALSLLRS
jgi:flagellin